MTELQSLLIVKMDIDKHQILSTGRQFVAY
jgi:hypothetical protein